jgi:hypothetical protein
MFGSQLPMKKSAERSSRSAAQGPSFGDRVFARTRYGSVIRADVSYPFINFDDPAYILERPEITRGRL